MNSNNEEKHCQACGWFGLTDHTCPDCGGQDWSPSEPAAPSAPPSDPSPVSPSRKPRR